MDAKKIYGQPVQPGNFNAISIGSLSVTSTNLNSLEIISLLKGMINDQTILEYLKGKKTNGSGSYLG